MFALRTLLLLALVAGCRSSSPSTDAPPAGSDAPLDVPMQVEDGVPMRRPCTENLGSALTQGFGRLDGYLVAVVPPGNGPCNADDTHVHLQVLALGSVYDIAVNVSETGVDDVHMTTRDLWLPTWKEGWHTDVVVDYVAFGVHSTDIPNRPSSQITSEMTAELANVNHISIFGTGYSGEGAHLIHRTFSGRDGMIVTQPLSTPSNARLFSFSNQAF